MVCKRWYSIFKTYRFLPDQTRVEKKRCGVSGFFPKCTKYKLVVFDTLVRLVFFSLPTIANSQGLHTIQHRIFMKFNFQIEMLVV